MKSTKKYIVLPNSLLVSLTLEHQQRRKKQDFSIFGLLDGEPNTFEKNVNYTGFLIKRK